MSLPLLFWKFLFANEKIYVQFTDAPFRTFWLAIKGAVRSTTFLSAFVGIFQVYFCCCSSSHCYYYKSDFFIDKCNINVLCAFLITQGVICSHRKVFSRDHKLVYWIAGGIAALSVLLEKKARRGELALYVLPRAVDSLWYILVNRHLLPNIRNAEVCPLVTLHWIKGNPFLICFSSILRK